MGLTQHDVPPDCWAAIMAAANASAPKAKPEPKSELPAPEELAAEVVASWCREFGWELPQTEYRFHPTRKWRWDLCWPGKMLAMELQGGIWGNGRHNRAEGFTNDCEKFSTGAAMGWRLLVVTYSQLNDGKLLGWLKLVFGEAKS